MKSLDQCLHSEAEPHLPCLEWLIIILIYFSISITLPFSFSLYISLSLPLSLSHCLSLSVSLPFSVCFCLPIPSISLLLSIFTLLFQPNLLQGFVSLSHNTRLDHPPFCYYSKQVCHVMFSSLSNPFFISLSLKSDLFSSNGAYLI